MTSNGLSNGILLATTLASASKLVFLENFLLVHTDHPLKAVAAKGFAYSCLFGALYFGRLLPRKALAAFSLLLCAYLAAQIGYMAYSGAPFLVFDVMGLWKEILPVLGNGGVFHSRMLWAFADLPLLVPTLLVLGRRASPRTTPAILALGISLATMAAVVGAKSEVFASFSLATRMKVGGFLFHEIAGTKERLLAGRELAWGPPRRGIHPPGLPPRNVVLIQMESLDARLPWASEDGIEVMPRLKALAREAFVYPYVLAYHGIGGSSDGDFSMEYSAPPHRKVRSLLFAADGGKPIPKLLDSSHLTYFVHGNEGDFFGRRAAYTKAGFDRLHFSEETGLPLENWGNADGAVFPYALDITRSSRPYFMHLITMSTHEPFDLWRTYYSTPAFHGSPGKNYYRGFRYADSVLGIFIDSLRRRRDTWILVTGDHTPGDLVEGYRSAYIQDSDGRLEFVPLFVISPNGERGCDDSLVHSFLDILPTVLSAAGSPVGFLGEGEDLATPGSPRGERPILLPQGGTTTKRALRRSIDSTLSASASSHWSSTDPCGGSPERSSPSLSR